MSLDFTSGAMNWDQLEKNLGADVKGGEKKSYKDDRFWSLSRDENDNGGAIIRLLPDPEGTPFIQRFNHAFQSFDTVNKKKRWYINISPQTINQDCPASELWSKLFNLGTDEAKLEAKNFSRKIKFMCNIKVIKDPANPQNEGKIFLWEFGTKLKDKFMQALNPSEADRQMGEEPKQLFNPLTGCNIKLKIKKAAGFLNYDDTTIEAVSSIYNDGEGAKADIINNAYKLSEFLQPEAFETYEELKGKLKYVTECYQPKSMDPVTFKNVVAEVVGSTAPAQTQAAQPAQIDTGLDMGTSEAPAVQPQPTQAAQPAAQTQAAPASNDTDLAFLDDL
jgi:hypothetical protein